MAHNMKKQIKNAEELLQYLLELKSVKDLRGVSICTRYVNYDDYFGATDEQIYPNQV